MILFYREIIFKGEYLNGEINEKGKDYYLVICGLKFEGEYLNGERNGQRKEYRIWKVKF